MGALATNIKLVSRMHTPDAHRWQLGTRPNAFIKPSLRCSNGSDGLPPQCDATTASSSEMSAWSCMDAGVHRCATRLALGSSLKWQTGLSWEDAAAI
jgi:hypothetical protein